MSPPNAEVSGPPEARPSQLWGRDEGRGGKGRAPVSVLQGCPLVAPLVCPEYSLGEGEHGASATGMGVPPSWQLTGGGSGYKKWAQAQG